MDSEYNFEAINVIGRKPMSMVPTDAINIYLITLICKYNPEQKIMLTLTSESIFGRKMLDKVKNNEVFEIDIK